MSKNCRAEILRDNVLNDEFKLLEHSFAHCLLTCRSYAPAVGALLACILLLGLSPTLTGWR